MYKPRLVLSQAAYRLLELLQQGGNCTRPINSGWIATSADGGLKYTCRNATILDLVRKDLGYITSDARTGYDTFKLY